MNYHAFIIEKLALKISYHIFQCFKSIFWYQKAT